MERRQVVGISVAPMIAVGLAMYAASWAPAAAHYQHLLQVGAAGCAGLSIGVWLCLLLTPSSPLPAGTTSSLGDDIGQRGVAVGSTIAANIDVAAGCVTFGQIHGSVHFDPKAEFEFRGHRLIAKDWAMWSESGGRPSLTSVSCEVIREPARWGP